MTSANPANPLTRAEFYNACTSVLQGLTCLQRQGAVVNEEAIETLDRLGLMVQDLRSDVQSNKEFYVDGPLVRFLTAQVSKGKSVIQEMKRTCSQNSSMINGPEFVERHLRQHVADIKAVITELTPYHNNQIFQQGTNNIDGEVQQRLLQDPRTIDTTLTPILKNGTTSSRKSDKIHFDETGDTSAQADPRMMTTRTPTANALNDLQQSPLSTPPEDPSTTDSTRLGVFEHMNEEKNIYSKHSPNWPAHEEKPPLLLERTRPPLVHNGLRDMQNYTNLPQYTGVNLPMPVMPDGEFGHRAPHTQHWDYHNNRMY
ncbi:uncharacterized protein [Apostichopus japonicus]|uniref:uncharacterized protein isoform X1 n=1 Tax=Stichopus japonicus TaxID=307972 RepID=UPI003AB7E85F